MVHRALVSCDFTASGLWAVCLCLGLFLSESVILAVS